MQNNKKGSATKQAHINRISGQVAGICRMIDSKKDGIVIIGQIMAAKASLEQLAVRILREEAKKCDKKKIDKVVNTLFKI